MGNVRLMVARTNLGATVTNLTKFATALATWSDNDDVRIPQPTPSRSWLHTRNVMYLDVYFVDGQQAIAARNDAPSRVETIVPDVCTYGSRFQ